MTPRSAPVGIDRAEAPRTNATPSHTPMRLAGSRRLYGHASRSENHEAPPSAAPARIEAPNPVTARLASDGARARSGARDGLDDIVRAGGCHRCLAGRRIDARGEHGLATVTDRERRGHEPVEQRVRPLGA